MRWQTMLMVNRGQHMQTNVRGIQKKIAGTTCKHKKEHHHRDTQPGANAVFDCSCSRGSRNGSFETEFPINFLVVSPNQQKREVVP